ncbi:MAG: hypothetical protein DLM61_21630, partial [Pseudonocardiales bacterium]
MSSIVFDPLVVSSNQPQMGGRTMFHKSTRTSKSTNHRFHPGIGGLSAIAALFVALVSLAAASVQGDGSHQTALARSSKCQSARVGDIYARQCSSPKGSRGPRGPRGLT